jgi:hypothetical protein
VLRLLGKGLEGLMCAEALGPAMLPVEACGSSISCLTIGGTQKYGMDVSTVWPAENISRCQYLCHLGAAVHCCRSPVGFVLTRDARAEHEQSDV